MVTKYSADCVTQFQTRKVKLSLTEYIVNKQQHSERSFTDGLKHVHENIKHVVFVVILSGQQTLIGQENN